MPKPAAHVILLLTVLLNFYWLPVSAQIRGLVYDSTDGRPVAGATISDFFGVVQAKADANGHFSVAKKVGQRLLITSVGYKSQELLIEQKTGPTVTLFMEPDSFQLGEVTVRAKREKYSRKGNPAVELMRKVIAAKKLTSLKNKDYYRYTNYQRITAGFNDLKQEDLQYGIFKNRPWMNQHIEICPYNNKLTMPLMMEETVSERLYRKSPHFEKEIVHGHKISGVSNLFRTGNIVNIILKEFFTDIDIYDNQIRFLNHSFTSPIGRDAIIFYHFYLTDTVVIDKDSCYQVDFIPANQQDFGFNGKLFILADSSYQVKRCEMSFPRRSDVNWVDRIKCVQEFVPLKNGDWVLGKDVMFAELMVVETAAKAFVSRNTTRSDFSFEALPDSLISGNRTTETVAESDLRTTDYWNTYRGGTLSSGELQVDSLVTKIEHIRGFNYMKMAMKALFEGFIETSSNTRKSKFDVGPIYSLLSTNSYDGLRLRVGGQTTSRLHPHFFWKGYAAHALGSGGNYYNSQLIYSFNTPSYQPMEFPKRAITFESMRDVAMPSDKFQDWDKDNVFSAIKITDVNKLFLYNRQSLRLDYEYLNGFKLFGELKTEKVQPLGVIDFRLVSSNRLLSNIRYSEGTLGLRFAPKETYFITKQQRWAINYNSPVVRLQHTMGFNSFLGGQYNYNYTELELSKPFWLPMNWGCIKGRALFGVQWNEVPYPLLIMPASNVSYFISEDMFDLINNMEFLNDRMASLSLGWDLNGKLFNRVPVLRKMKCREFLGVKCLWGRLTDKNNPQKNRTSDILLYFPDGSNNVMNPDRPYWECSVGIHNLFHFLHIEYIRRLSYLELPTSNKRAVKFAFEFKF